ncbi:hypothetical protein pb186bvf_019069 [Paramecium bursaria]
MKTNEELSFNYGFKSHTYYIGENEGFFMTSNNFYQMHQYFTWFSYSDFQERRQTFSEKNMMRHSLNRMLNNSQNCIVEMQQQREYLQDYYHIFNIKVFKELIQFLFLKILKCSKN